MELDSYEINNDTCVIIPVGKNKSKVFEGDSIFFVNKSCLKIIEVVMKVGRMGQSL